MIVYAQQVDAGGIPVRASTAVRPEALQAAAFIVNRMLQGPYSQQIRQALGEAGVRVAVIGEHEETTDIPEHADLNTAFPEGADWNARTRGVGATPERPVCSFAEENLLGLPGDRYWNEKIAYHEWAHAIHEMGARRFFAGTDALINGYHGASIAAGLWAGTYARTLPREWWAEISQCWFDVNATADPPDGIHNNVGTRAALQAYDVNAAALCALAYGEAA